MKKSIIKAAAAACFAGALFLNFGLNTNVNNNGDGWMSLELISSIPQAQAENDGKFCLTGQTSCCDWGDYSIDGTWTN